MLSGVGTVDGPVDDEGARIVSAVRSLLPAAVRSWEITAQRRVGDGTWTLSMSHEASHGLVFESMPVDADATIAALRSMLPRQHRELERVGHAPALTHPDIVMELRALARIFDWTRTEVVSVVRLVEERLSPDEVEWLTRWVGRDEKPRPMSLDG